MKVWVLFAVRFEHDWGHGLDDVVGAALDEEEAKEIARRTSIAYYREHADEFARVNRYELERWGLIDMSIDDDTMWGVIESAGTHRVEVRELELGDALDLHGLSKGERRDVLQGLAALLRPFRPGAAKALEEDA